MGGSLGHITIPCEESELLTVYPNTNIQRTLIKSVNIRCAVYNIKSPVLSCFETHKPNNATENRARGRHRMGQIQGCETRRDVTGQPGRYDWPLSDFTALANKPKLGDARRAGFIKETHTFCAVVRTCLLAICQKELL